MFPVQVLLGLVAAAVSPRGFIRTECAFVTIMEALQLVGLLVADDCAGTLNRAVTYLSYIHISLQPWCYNEWQWAMSEMRTLMHPEAARTARRGEEHKRLVRGLSAAWCVGTLLRLVPCFREPCYYCAQREHFCAFDGSSACTMMGSLHIYWRLPLRPSPCPCHRRRPTQPNWGAMAQAVQKPKPKRRRRRRRRQRSSSSEGACCTRP